jgi:hypothetical protein
MELCIWHLLHCSSKYVKMVLYDMEFKRNAHGRVKCDWCMSKDGSRINPFVINPKQNRIQYACRQCYVRGIFHNNISRYVVLPNDSIYMIRHSDFDTDHYCISCQKKIAGRVWYTANYSLCNKCKNKYMV